MFKNPIKTTASIAALAIVSSGMVSTATMARMPVNPNPFVLSENGTLFKAAANAGQAAGQNARSSVYCRTGSPPPCPPTDAPVPMGPNGKPAPDRAITPIQETDVKADAPVSQVCPPQCGPGGVLNTPTAVGRPIKWPPVWQFKTIPPVGCVLRPGSASASAEMGCTVSKTAVTSCKAAKGTIGMIDDQLYCRQPFVEGTPPPPRDTAGRQIKPPLYPNDYPDEAMQARWEPINGQPQD
jgi:hypothetical protein